MKNNNIMNQGSKEGEKTDKSNYNQTHIWAYSIYN